MVYLVEVLQINLNLIILKDLTLKKLKYLTTALKIPKFNVFQTFSNFVSITFIFADIDILRF